MCILIFATNSIANAQLWKPYRYGARSESHFDAISIDRNGSLVFVKVLVNLLSPSVYRPTGLSYTSLIADHEINCLARTWSYQKTEAWKYPFGKGKLIYRADAFISEVMEIEPAQNVDELHNILYNTLKEDGSDKP